MSSRFACTAVFACCLAQTASAQPSVARYLVTSTQYPQIDVETDPIPTPTREQTFLVDENGIRAPATRLERRSVPIDIVLVVESSLSWIRNDVDEEDKRSLSGLNLVHGLIASEVWREHAPAGSTITIVTYDSKAHLALSPTRIEALPSLPLGSHENYNDVATSPAEGVRLGIEQLKSLSARRRLLIVIGDGLASDHKSATALLDRLRVDASSAGVDVNALVYETWLPVNDSSAIKSLVASPTIVTSVSDAAVAMRKAIDDVPDAYVVSFDATSFDWNGETHWGVTLEAGGWTLLPIGIQLPEHGLHTPLSPWRWPLAAMTVIIAGLFARRMLRKTRATA